MLQRQGALLRPGFPGLWRAKQGAGGPASPAKVFFDIRSFNGGGNEGWNPLKFTTFTAKHQTLTGKELDERFMKEALREAQKAFDKDEVPVGAVVLCNERIIARAHNLTETLNDPTAHAEMQAITAAAAFTGGKYLEECTFYISVEPCVMCAGALFWSQAGRIVFGASDNKRGFRTAGSPILHPRTRLSEGVMAAEAEYLMKEFFKKKR